MSGTLGGRSRLRMGRLAPAAVALLMLSGPATAQSREVVVGQRGAARIFQIEENGRFSRCAAQFESPHGYMRIAWSRDRTYGITVPSVPQTGPVLLRLVDTPGGTITMQAAGGGSRTGARLSSQTVEAVLRIRGRMIVTLDNRRFEYSLGGASMEEILMAVEDCLHRAVNRR